MKKVIEINNLKKTYKQGLKTHQALFGIDFCVYKNEICGFLGPNGAGKSTTLKIMMDFIRADKGSVRINGVDSTKTVARKRIGFMPENPPYIDTLTGKELLLLSARMHGVNKDVAKKKAKELLEKLDLEESANKRLRDYSKGMIQRIGFASSLIIDPKILILDEPMSGLDPIGRYKFKNMIKESKEAGITILFSSHIISDIEDLCDRVVIVNKGRVVDVVEEEKIRLSSIEGYIIIISNEVNIDKFNYFVSKNGLKNIRVKKDELNDAIIKLKKQNINIISVEPIKKDLEDLFIDIVSKNKT